MQMEAAYLHIELNVYDYANNENIERERGRESAEKWKECQRERETHREKERFANTKRRISGNIIHKTSAMSSIHN